MPPLSDRYIQFSLSVQMYGRNSFPSTAGSDNERPFLKFASTVTLAPYLSTGKHFATAGAVTARMVTVKAGGCGISSLHVQRAAELAPAFECDGMLFPEELEDGDAGLPGAVIVVRSVLPNHIDEPTESAVEIPIKEESKSLTIVLPPGAGREALGIRHETVQAGDGPDRLRHLRKPGVINIFNKAGRLRWILEERKGGQKDPRLVILRVRLNNLLEEALSLRALSLLEKLLCLRKLFCELAGERLLQPPLDLIVWERTDELVGNGPVDKELDVWNAAHLVARRDFRELFRIEFCQRPILAIFLRESLQNRAQDTARPAPLCPEIDKHRNFVAPLKDLLFEI
jgi:hypothetical protein